MRKILPFAFPEKLGAAIRTLVCFYSIFHQFAMAQETVYQRTFPVSISEVSSAIQRISASSEGRLPTLEGFTSQTSQEYARYSKGYYECTFQVLPGPSGGTVVRATAKVTAWYNDADAARSGYRVLVSNGRLEEDALDRLGEALNLPALSGTASATQPTIPTGSSSKDAKSAGLILPRTSSYGSSAASPAPFAAESASTLPSANRDSIEPVGAADKKKLQELTTYIQNLEEILRNQSHPMDLAAVKKANTPIVAQPAESARILMTADAEDEFQVLGVDGGWVHLQISGMSRGWIRLNQLEMPLELSQSASPNQANSSATEAAFKISREETTSFRGNWQPLKGKAVRIEWVEPVNSTISTSRKEKLTFAKTVFVRSIQNPSQAQKPVEGIVVVFDSADGGQIAAPAASVKALAERTLSEVAFWHECSFDPPESFLGPTKKERR